MTTKKTPKKRPQPTKATPKVKAPAAVPAPVAVPETTTPNNRGWYIALFVFGVVLLGLSTALAMSSQHLSSLELRIFEHINNMQLPHWVSSQIAKPLSNAVWGMVGLVIILLCVPKYRLRAWQYAIAMGGAFGGETIIAHIVDRARPDGLGVQLVLRAHQDGPGFPSGHVAVLTALGLTLWPMVSWPWRILIAGLIVAEAWSRIFLGVHAPLDVVGGFAVGCVAVGFIHLLPEKIRKFFHIHA